MKVLILAQGTGSRWNINLRGLTVPSEYKQLIPYKSGETLLGRTIRQVKSHGIEYPIVIANCGDFVHLDAPIRELREPTGSIIHGILSLRNYWMTNEKIVFVLGDVVFSNIMLSLVVNQELDGISFYGRKGGNEVTGKEAKEIFALKVCGSVQVRENFYRHLMMLRDDTSAPNKLKLWDLYHWLKIERANAVFLTVDKDYTDDIDSPKHYELFWDKLEEAVVEDDSKHRS